MICVISDTHGDMGRFNDRKIRGLKKGDYLIICGDFGFVWDGSDKEKALLKKIGARKHTTLFITGSHDNYDLLEQYPEEDFFGGKARRISGELYMLSSGHIFEIDGKKIFAFGGGQSSDMDARMESSTWWEQELPDEELLEEGRKRLSEAGSVDYIFTHEPPGKMADFLITDRTSLLMGRLNVYFDELKAAAAFKMWFFGKLHKNKIIPPKYMAVFDEPYIIE
ncbi:MAG: metallophosphoesterase [Huintestinicola sp.]